MKKTGRCPKCDSTAIHVVDATRTELSIALGSWSKALVENYCCVSCGYVELYVADEKSLPKIAERWPRWRG